MSLINAILPDDILPLGQKVYIPRQAVNLVHEDEILGYECELTMVENDWVLMPTSYLLSLSNTTNNTPGWKRDQFCLSESEAQSKCKVYSIKTSINYFKAIGLDPILPADAQDFNERCELPNCCDTSKNIRSILYNAARGEALSSLNRDTLVQLLSSHEPPEEGEYPELAKLLSLFELDWKSLHAASVADQ